ncbi:hypothetical protein [Reichenbachiella sp. MALMAid0571]|uniref:hypothetical protein n=1 Tax=Reichenbachiella sp. MALMAid0571 TaxID=3143939 RepID=UPI0032DF1F56
MKFVLMLICSICLVPLAMAQDLEIEEDGEVQTGEIIIEKDRKIVLPQARKLYEKVNSPEYEIEAATFPGEFKIFNYSPATQLPTLRAAQPKLEGTQDDVYNHYVKVGFGNYSSPMLVADMNLITNQSRIFRLNLDHLSFGKGAKDGKNSGSAYTNAGINGKIIGESITFSTGVNYSITNDYFYGYQPGLEVDRSDIKHKYDFINALVGIEDNDQDNLVDYSLSVSYESVKDNYAASESGVEIGAGFNYAKTIFIDNEAILTKYKQTSFDLSRSFFRINPYYRIEAGEATIDAGFSFTAISGGVETFGSSTIFPFARASYSISEQVNLFANLDGGMSFNSYADYARENPYLMDDLAVLSSRINYDFKAGAAIKPAQQFALTAYVQLQSIKNMGYYQNMLPDTTTFEVAYIPGNTSVVEFGSKMQFDINSDNQIGLNAAILSYSSKDVTDFYNLPTSRVELIGNHKIMDKLSIGWQFNLLGGIKGLASNGLTTGNETTTSMSAITEFNLNLDYQINDRIGAFLRFDNILNKNYERFYNYPMRGLQVKAGVSFRF